MTGFFLIAAGLHGALAVAASAFAAHGLEPIKGARAVELWQIASQQQLIHAAALVGVAALQTRQPARALRLAGGCFALGATLFPGALYSLGWFGPSFMGAVAPLGGITLILGWICVAVAAGSRRSL